MHYQGGKSFVGKKIAEYINPFIGKKKYFEPFCGGLGVTEHIKADELFLSDFNAALITLYLEIIGGWNPPNRLSEKQYKQIKIKQDFCDPITAFAGIGCSWGGKWFGGYARSETRNYAKEAAKSLKRKLTAIKNAEFYNCDYRKLKQPNNSVIYCDPPYQGLTKFTGSQIRFDHVEFWEIIRKWSKKNLVFISHHCAPDDFECVKEIPTVHGIRRKVGKSTLIWDGKMEKLYKYKDNHGITI